MEGLTVLRRLAEQNDYQALRDAALGTDTAEPGVQILAALAEAQLGDSVAARRRVAPLDPCALPIDARVDLAAVRIALGETDRATALLETARLDVARADRSVHALLLARLAWCRLQHGRDDEALALYRQSVALHPFLAVYHNLLRLYRDRGRFADMALCLDAAWSFWAERQADWPDTQRVAHSRQLRGMQLDLWLGQAQVADAEAWVLHQRDTLGEDDWCALVIDLGERLAARDRHAQAEEWLRTALRRYPQHRPLYQQLAALAQLQGRPLQAIALLRRAIRLAAARDEPADGLWTRLSAIALPIDAALARMAAEQARDELARRSEPAEPGGAGEHESAERRVQVELALADVEAREQDYPAAERRYRQILDATPRNVAALQGLGQLSLQLGRLDQAVGLFEQVAAIDPARGYGALIAARRFPDSERALRRLERFARTPGLHGSIHASLLFQLAVAWERREAYDQAFALANDANAASRRLLQYDPTAHRQRCARIRHAFPKSLYERRAGCGHDSTLPVFVVGMPRSGTTLVEQIIAGHSRVHGAGELGTIPRVVAGLARWERHTGSGRGYPDCVDDLDPAVTRGIAESVLQELRGYAPEADHVVDKLPHNFENIGLIRLLFPRAKIISVRRDPRDIAVSNFFTDFVSKHGGMGFAYHLDWIGEQLADHNLLMRHWQQVWPEGILEIRYEDLVNDPEAGARRMLDHIGVGWEPQVLDFDALQRPVRTASVWQVRQPLYRSSTGRWQHYRQHLKPLIAATNRRIVAEPVEMVTLPQPGWLNAGVDHYRQGRLDDAERCFKRLLHHLPMHAAAGFMLGLTYLGKGYRRDGIRLMEQAVERCPWNRHWRRDLAAAYRLDGREQDAATVAGSAEGPTADALPIHTGEGKDIHLDYLFLSGDSSCSSLASATSGANC